MRTLKLLATATAIMIIPIANDARATQQQMSFPQFTALSLAVVRATASPDLFGTTKIDPKLFAACFKSRGLTEGNLKAIVKAGAPDSRLPRATLSRPAYWSVAAPNNVGHPTQLITFTHGDLL
jgi:hypothetical protein